MFIHKLQEDRNMSTEEIQDLIEEDARAKVALRYQKIYDNLENGRDEKHDRE